MTDSDTALLENICAITLYRKYIYNADFKPYFYNKEVELDFYIPAICKGIQASFSIRNQETLEREIKALITFHNLYDLKEAEIVTFSEEKIIETDSLTINVLPLAKWLIDNDLPSL